MSEKSHVTIVDDIYEVVDSPHEVNPENIKQFMDNTKEMIETFFSHTQANSGNHLRLSGYGKPPRQLWYTLNRDRETLKPETRLKFLFGHFIEELVLLLVKEAGHKVEHEQRLATYKGIPGSMDCIIDGVVYDIKGLSPMGVDKFKYGKIFDNDSFHYLPQIKAYHDSAMKEGLTNSNDMGFLILNKIGGDFYNFIMDDTEGPNIEEVANKAIEVSKMDSPPEEKCYEPEEKSNGNKKLPIGCQYCPFKHECWADANGGKGVRTFQYSRSKEYLVYVENEPRVEEITND